MAVSIIRKILFALLKDFGDMKILSQKAPQNFCERILRGGLKNL